MRTFNLPINYYEFFITKYRYSLNWCEGIDVNKHVSDAIFSFDIAHTADVP